MCGNTVVNRAFLLYIVRFNSAQVDLTFKKVVAAAVNDSFD